MSLLSALNLGSQAMQAQQLALQTTGNNIANANNPDFARETTEFSPAPDQTTGSGLLVGTGVDVVAIQRQVDNALNERLRGSVSDQASAGAVENWSGQVQSVFNALSGDDLSSQMTTFFNDWSNLANNPTDNGDRQTVIQDGQSVGGTLNSLNSQINNLSSTLGDSMTADVKQINHLTREIAGLNGQIVSGATASGQANSLLDQRDTDLAALSKLVNVQSVTQPTGGINLYIGSQEIVTNTTARRLQVTTTAVNNHLVGQVVFVDDNSTANVTSGDLGGLLHSQTLMGKTSASLNAIASNLIFTLNKVHSSGQGTEGFTNLTSATQVLDPTQPLSSSASGLQFSPNNGSFVLHVTDKKTGLATSALIQVHLTGSSSDTSLNSLAASINATGLVTASVAGGHLTLKTADSDHELSFSQDSSGALAALGINTFFTGSDASNIGVNATVVNTPQYLAAAKNGDPTDNSNAVALSTVGGINVAALSNVSVTASYRNMVESIGATAATAKNNSDAATTVTQTLTAQQQSLSGVSTDQEALNLMAEQRAFQAAAYLITTVNTMMQSLFAIT